MTIIMLFQIWTPRVTRFAYLLPWVLPFFIAFYCWFQDARYVPILDPQNSTIGYAVLLTDEAYEVRNGFKEIHART